MNSNRIINLPDPVSGEEAVPFHLLQDLIISQTPSAIDHNLYESVAAATLTNILGTVNVIRTAGYLVRGDGGQALYIRGTVSTIGGFQSADGTWWKLALNQRITPQMFGAKGDGIVNDSVAVRNAVSFCQATGVGLWLTSYYLLTQDGANSWCLLLSQGIDIRGDGVAAGFFTPGSLSNTVNTVAIIPDPAIGMDKTIIENIGILDITNGLRNGLHGIYIDTSILGATITGLQIRDCFIGYSSSGGSAIYHTNGAGANPNGGLFNCTITGNRALAGGISLNGSGDTILIENNVIYGEDVLGIYSRQIAGAAGLSILNNNITTHHGAIVIDSGTKPIIKNNICETYLNSYVGPLVWLKGSVGTIFYPEICSNVLTVLPSTSINNIILVSNTIGGLFETNDINSTYATNGISISGSSQNTVGRNRFGALVNPHVDDGLSATKGVVFNPVLLNSWANVGGTTQPIQWCQDKFGRVFVDFSLTGGTSGATAFSLPIAPAKNQTYLIYSAGSVPTIATLTISSGGVAVITTTNNSTINANVSFLAADQGDILS